MGSPVFSGFSSVGIGTGERSASMGGAASIAFAAWAKAKPVISRIILEIATWGSNNSDSPFKILIGVSISIFKIKSIADWLSPAKGSSEF